MFLRLLPNLNPAPERGQAERALRYRVCMCCQQHVNCVLHVYSLLLTMASQLPNGNYNRATLT